MSSRQPRQPRRPRSGRTSRPPRPARTSRAPRSGLHDLDLHGLTHGGEAVGRLDDGKACFVPYAIPGERVRVEVVEERATWARARLVEVLDPSPDRVEAPCPYFGPDQCGGCKLQHVAPARQRQMKRRIVVEQLERIGRITDPPVRDTVAIGPLHYRAAARFAVDEAGRLAFRRAGSHDLVPIDHCLLLDAPTQALREEAGDAWEGVEEVEVRTGDGGRGVLTVHPGAAGVPAAPPGAAAVALVAASGRTTPLRGDATLTATTGAHTYRLSAGSFFQSSPAGAAALVDLVLEAAAVAPGDAALDLFAGVGLFTVPLAAAGARVTAVEADPAAVADAHRNVEGLDAEVEQDDAEAAVARRVEAGAHVDVVVLDPPRRGAGAELAVALTHLTPRVIVYVSCDPAALARDARALTEAGYALTDAVPVDQFAQTAHVETVATFRPSA